MKLNLLKIESVYLCRRKALNLPVKIDFPNSYLQERSLWTTASHHTKKEGMALPAFELIFPLEVDLPDVVYLPFIFCEPCNSAATTGTLGEA